MTRPPGPPPPPPPPAGLAGDQGWGQWEQAKATPGRVTPAPGLVKILTTDIDGHVNCAHCDYSTAGNEIKDAAIDHTQQTGHTTVINLRAIQRIRPA